MPLINCTLIQGYDDEVRQRLAERVTDAACSSIGAAADFVTVTISEVEPGNYMRGRTKRVPASAPRPAEEIVRSFLASLESRDLEAAKSHLSEDFTMTFPGTAKFAALEELVAWSGSRYRSISKTFDGFDTAFHGTRSTVFCFGTLSGTWPDGTDFSGIRFIDRFELEGETITSQMVWNDLAEMRPA
ncbi:MAG: tautomerase family protein [Rhodobiaceae bacterium]|jgi:phenylpyruvate tautomerase PptA (4-oxalocrotonate tautomerase family)/limonene-1,2-epoxide hydrolase